MCNGGVTGCNGCVTGCNGGITGCKGYDHGDDSDVGDWDEAPGEGIGKNLADERTDGRVHRR